ncbi:MAG: hypothetical protein AB7U73_08275 [Pirellulales bacterium]
MDYTKARNELLRQAIDRSLPGTKMAGQRPIEPVDVTAIDPLPVYEDFDTGELLVERAEAEAEAARRYFAGYQDGLAFGKRQWLVALGMATVVSLAAGVLLGLAIGT